METKKISSLNSDIEIVDGKFKNNILTNTTNKVPHIAKSLPIYDNNTYQPGFCLKKIKQINPHYYSFPAFYKKELKRHFFLMIMWIVLLGLCFILELITAFLIVKSKASNSLLLMLVPGFVLCFSFFIIYTHNYLNYFNEAKSIDFSKEKIVTVNVNKLYKRLKTAHININWMCLLTYCLGLLIIFVNYLIAWFLTIKHHKTINFGNLDFAIHGHYAYLVILVLAVIMIFVALFLHGFLLVKNYIRASNIDQYYAIQIVSDEELK